MQVTEFVLCPDKESARFLRRALAERAGSIGVRIGTWPELLEQATSSYCLAPSLDRWMHRLESEASDLTDCFWAASLEVDGGKTVEALGRALRDVILALGPGRRIARASESVSSRGARQLADLDRLWEAMGCLLPDDLARVEQVVESPSERAVRGIRVHLTASMEKLNTWQLHLVDKLTADVGNASPPPLPLSEVLGQMQLPATAKGDHAFRHLQRELFGPSTSGMELDRSVQWLAVRDPLEEVETVAGMIQRAFEDDADLRPSDIAIMIPADELYASSLHHVFSWAGLPLSGLSWTAQRRDLGREAVQQFLLCRCPEATPVMALASLVSSPLMPWRPRFGRRIAQAVMGQGIQAIHRFLQEDETVDLLRLLVDTDQKPETLLEALTGFCGLLRIDRATEIHVELAKKAVFDLAEDLGAGEIDWPRIIDSCRPQQVLMPIHGPTSREGIAVFLDHEEPWRSVRKLYLIGFSAGRYPREPRAPMILVEADRAAMNQEMLFRFELAAEAQHRRRQRLLRQLLAASEALTCTIPRKDFSGAQLAPSSTLSHMALVFGQVSHAEELILELDRPDERGLAIGLAASVSEVDRPRPFMIEDLDLGRDLLGAGVAGRLQPRAQSPSRLETLLVSPLAWMLQHLNAEPAEWHADRLDVLMRGTLAHDVFERIFAVGQPLPAVGDIEDLVHRAIAPVIETNAPHLASPAWRIERRHLERELREAALSWRTVLEESGAEVLRTEENLSGSIEGCEMRGRVDAVLRMPSGALIVVDYKKSKGQKRIPRMEKGYDLQASLYRRMLENWQFEGRNAEEPVGIAYYNLNDQITLTDRAFGLGDEPPGVRLIEGDVSREALALLRKRFKELRAGRVVLNRIEDGKRIERDTGIQPFALDNSPLIGLFSHPEPRA